MARMDRRRFEKLVEEAIASLPAEIRGKMDNVAVLVEDRPGPDETPRGGRRGELLLGLYRGQPLTARDSRYGMVLPDTITIYQANLEAISRNDDEIREEVRRTVLHEIAHHFGIDDERLHQLGY
jgi:predicted Zn-dependent protease with MMP-like domain